MCGRRGTEKGIYIGFCYKLLIDFHSLAHRVPSLAQQHIHNIPGHVKESHYIYPT